MENFIVNLMVDSFRSVDADQILKLEKSYVLIFKFEENEYLLNFS
jgi:hypothetical protein